VASLCARVTKRCRKLSGQNVWLRERLQKYSLVMFMMMSTPFAFDIVEHSVRITVDGDIYMCVSAGASCPLALAVHRVFNSPAEIIT